MVAIPLRRVRIVLPCRILSCSSFSACALLVCACARTPTELIAPLDAPAITAANAARAASTEPAASRREAEGPSALAMERVDFHVAADFVLHVAQLRGQAVATESDQPVSFDDRRSFLIRIANADVAITLDDLGRLLNQYVFAYPAAPLFDLHRSLACRAAPAVMASMALHVIAPRRDSPAPPSAVERDSTE